jgi:hypothetical protein
MRSVREAKDLGLIPEAADIWAMSVVEQKAGHLQTKQNFYLV